MAFKKLGVWGPHLGLKFVYHGVQNHHSGYPLLLSSQLHHPQQGQAKGASLVKAQFWLLNYYLGVQPSSVSKWHTQKKSSIDVIQLLTILLLGKVV